MKASEIVPHVMRKRELSKQAQAEAPTAVHVGGKAVPNRPLKGKKRKPYMGPVMALVELPKRRTLMGENTALKSKVGGTSKHHR